MDYASYIVIFPKVICLHLLKEGHVNSAENNRNLDLPSLKEVADDMTCAPKAFKSLPHYPDF